MKNKLFLILLAVIIFSGGVLSARVFTGGGEDAWICENGVWVRHGNPASPEPQEPCGEDVFSDLTGDEPALGGDRDEHGCIGSAGYTWCEAKEKCLRLWEEQCVAAGVDIDAIAAAVKRQLVEKHGSLAESMTVSVNTVEGDYAQGGARDQAAEAGGGMWFAAFTGGAWKLVWDGNGTISCGDIAAYDFPGSMIPECYDEAAGQMVTR